MDYNKITESVNYFLKLFPEGYENHNFSDTLRNLNIEEKSIEAQEKFKKENFDDIELIFKNFVSFIPTSFILEDKEIAKLKNSLENISFSNKNSLIHALFKLLHQNRKEGFKEYLHVLEKLKISKWSIATFLLYYYDSSNEVFIPSEYIEKIISFYNLPLVYKNRPTYNFYNDFKKTLEELYKSYDKNKICNNTLEFTTILVIGLDMLPPKT